MVKQVYKNWGTYQHHRPVSVHHQNSMERFLILLLFLTASGLKLYHTGVHPWLQKQSCSFYRQSELRVKLVMTAPLIFRGIILGHIFLKTIKVLRSNRKHFWILTDCSCPCVYKASSYSHTSWNIQARHISQENLNFSRLKTTAYVTSTTVSP